MHTATDKKRIILYAVSAFFFCLAGVFQAYDSELPEFWHALFALSAHTILISLVVAWGVSLIHRMVRKDLRAFFIAIAALILFFLVVRMIKYGLTKDADMLSRYLWYSYYVPQSLIPPTILLAALSLENKKGRPISKTWYLLYLPAIIIIVLIFTNDLHELAFALDFNGEFSYKHRAVFYIALAWEIIVTLAGLAALIMKCGVSACKRRTWIPVTAFVSCAVVSAVCFLTNTSAFKIPELLCFTCVVMIESCIAIGLIPSNENYEEFFRRSKYSAVITDEDFNVVYSSLSSPVTEKTLLKQAAEGSVMTDENTRLSAEKIHGGFAFRSEDISKINEINAALSDANERLAEENYLIDAENRLKEQKAQIEEQNRLYAKTEEYTHSELERLSAILAEIRQNDKINPDVFTEKMRFACLLAAYIKRRSNLVMLAEKYKHTDAGELSLAIKESLGYLALNGAECSYDCAFNGQIDGRTAGVLYDFFEMCVADYDNLPTAVITHLSKRGENIVLLVESDAVKENIDELSVRIKSRFAEYKNNITVKTDGEAVYYSLSLPTGDKL